MKPLNDLIKSYLRKHCNVMIEGSSEQYAGHEANGVLRGMNGNLWPTKDSKFRKCDPEEAIRYFEENEITPFIKAAFRPEKYRMEWPVLLTVDGRPADEADLEEMRGAVNLPVQSYEDERVQKTFSDLLATINQSATVVDADLFEKTAPESQTYSLCSQTLCRPGDEAIAESFVVQNAMRQWEIISAGRPSLIQWKIAPELNVSKTSAFLVVKYDDNGPDYDFDTGRRCHQDKRWKRVDLFARFRLASVESREAAAA